MARNSPPTTTPIVTPNPITTSIPGIHEKTSLVKRMSDIFCNLSFDEDYFYCLMPGYPSTT